MKKVALGMIFGFIGLLLCWLFFWQLPVNGWHIINTGEGRQVGYISAVETSGIFWKTGTVYIKPTLESTQEDVYCIIDKEMMNQLGELSKTKANIEIKSIDYFMKGVRECNGELGIITSFTVIGQKLED